MIKLTPRRRVGLVALGVTCVALAFMGSSCSTASDSQKAETAQQEQISSQMIKNQPLPQFNYSQMRKNLIEIETAQAQGVQTTSFFFNQGVQDPIFVCPSIGVPIPNTASLSNPLAVERHGGSDGGQMDPNGVYSPTSATGTFVICVGANGQPFAKSWEGFVDAVFAPARWNQQLHQEEIIGPASFKFSVKQGN